MGGKVETRRQFLGKGVGATALAGAVGLARARGSAAAPKPTSSSRKPMPLGLPTYMFKHYNLDQTIEMAKRVNVRHICLRSTLLPLSATDEQIAASVGKTKRAGLVPYAGGVIYMRDEKAARRAFQYAKVAGFKLITISPRPNLLPLLDKLVRKYDIKAAIHNHGPEDKAYPTPVAVYQKVKKLDKRIGICHDTGHTQRAGMDPAETTSKVADRLMDIHLKDVDAPTRKGRSTELGRGVVDIPKFLRTLLEINYPGVVGIEYEKLMTDILPGLAESVGYTRGVLAALD